MADDQVAQLADLMALLSDWLQSGHGTLVGCVSRWLAVQRGTITPDDPCPIPLSIPASDYVPPVIRREMALAVARRDGHVSTLQMADACGVGQEAIRKDLTRLEAEGYLVAEGEKRGRIWRAAGGG
jgi:biotin operon repressor